MAIGRLTRKIGAPADRVDQPAARERADRAGDGAGRRPGADGAAARFAVEGGAEQGEAGGHEERGADALGDARSEQHREARCQRTAERCQREHQHAGEQGALAAPTVAGDAAEQDQRAERQQVGVDEPGDRGAARAEIVLDRRQADVDDGAVDEGQARAEDGRRQRAGRMGRGATTGGALPRRDDAVIAGSGDRRGHAAFNLRRSGRRRQAPQRRVGSIDRLRHDRFPSTRRCRCRTRRGPGA